VKIKNKLSLKKIGLGFLLFTFVLLLDRWTKILVLRHLQTKTFNLMPYVDFVYVQNKGVAFGLFGSANVNFVLLSLVSIVLILIVMFRFFHKENPLLLSLLLAGALGNIWDRLLYGFVVDFIKIGSFYVFNVADSAITISACWIVLMVFHENRKETELPTTH
jgi:signal peptidase II